MTQYRTEHDTMGEVQVPVDALYGAQTQRALDNFLLSNLQLPAQFIHALSTSKKPPHKPIANSAY